MTRRNQKKFSTRTKRYDDNDQKLVKKLDLRKLNYFKYDAKEVFNSTDMEQKVWNPLFASIVTKASRIGINDAKDYIRKLEKEEILSKDTAGALMHLLDKYKRWR